MPQVVSGTYQDYRISPSPDTAKGLVIQQAAASSSHAGQVSYGASGVPQNGESSLKRKENDSNQGAGPSKRRRDSDDFGEMTESDVNAQAAKHWSDEEKAKLFHWLMGPGQDDHWQSLRATKNSCLREVREHYHGRETRLTFLNSVCS